MLKRIGTAIILLAVIFACVFWLRKYSLIITDAVIMIFAIVGGYEMYKSLKKRSVSKAVVEMENGEVKVKEFKLQPMLLPIVIAMLIIYPLTYFLRTSGIFATIAICTMISLFIMVIKHKKYSVSDVCATVFNIIYPIAIMSALVIMNHSRFGLLSVFATFAVVVMTDTMAYFVGITCKGPKLCPNISPKKTISGAVGGLLGGVLGMVITYLLFCQFNLFSYMGTNESNLILQNVPLNLAILLPLGAFCSVFAELGDLAASIIKRKIGIKDYGNIFPGHGGVMDRIDSFLAVIPIMFIAFEILEIAI